MEEAIQKGVLCKYMYYPHLVRLTSEEMDAYVELSDRIAKYFNFDKLYPELAKRRSPRRAANKLLVRLLPQGIKGRIVIMADHPRHGTRLGVIRLSGREPQEIIQKCARVPKAPRLQGKHALYFVFESATPDQSLCELEDFVFARRKS